MRVYQSGYNGNRGEIVLTVHDYATKMSFSSAKEIREVFYSAEWVSATMGMGWEQMLPRIKREENQWFAECWWRSFEDGTLGYYAKINMQTGMVKEFRELSQDIKVAAKGDIAAQEQYLAQCVAVLNDVTASMKTATALDLLWQAAVPDALRETAVVERNEETLETILLPLDTVTYWNWEKLKPLLLKRYDTTVEDILDYLEYLDSDSEELYVEPKKREEARKMGVRFWRDGYDV